MCLCGVSAGVFFLNFFFGSCGLEGSGGVGVLLVFLGDVLRGFLMVFFLWLRVLMLGVLACVGGFGHGLFVACPD